MLTLLRPPVTPGPPTTACVASTVPMAIIHGTRENAMSLDLAQGGASSAIIAVENQVAQLFLP